MESRTPIQSVREWNVGEVPWIERMLDAGGHPSIGDGRVAEYIRVQIAGAKVDRRPDVIAHLETLLPRAVDIDTKNRGKVVSSTRKAPAHTPQAMCPSCVFIGHYLQRDVYSCARLGQPPVVLVQGAHEYSSILVRALLHWLDSSPETLDGDVDYHAAALALARHSNLIPSSML